MSCPTCREIGQIRGAQDGRRIVRQDDVPAVPGAMDDGLHERAGHLGRGVHVRDEPDRRGVTLDRRRDGRHQIAVLVQRDIREPDLAELGGEHVLQGQLSRGARTRRRAFIGTRIDLHVSKKTSEDAHALWTIRRSLRRMARARCRRARARL